MTLTQLQAIVAQLDRRRCADATPYLIYFAVRTPEEGRSRGLRGVDDESLIQCYATELRRSYDHLRDLGWAEPRVESGLGHIPVYVFDAPKPFTAPHRRDFSIVGLRSEIGEPTDEGIRARAGIDACHEVVHTFTHRHRSLKVGESAPWAWFDEATAVYFERRLCPGNVASLHYARDWINRPELPIERSSDTGYAAAWLVQHLVERYGIDFLRRVWQDARLNETPVVAINRFLGGGVAFQDFMHDYAVKSYRTEVIDPHVFRRFGDRRFSYVVRLGDEGAGPADLEWDDTLGPLGCRYYRIDTRYTSPRKVCLEVRPRSSARRASLCVAAILDQSAGNAPSTIPLRPADTPEGEHILQSQITLPAGATRLVMSVVNTESGQSAQPDHVLYPTYRVRVTAAHPDPPSV